MKVETYTFQNDWDKPFNTSLDSEQTLVLIFSPINTSSFTQVIDSIYNHFPNSKIMGASSIANIVEDEIIYDTLSVAVIHFSHTKIKLASVCIDDHTNAFEAGKVLTTQLLRADMKHMFVLSGGMYISGSELTKGINLVLPSTVFASGGVASGIPKDKTWVLSDHQTDAKKVVAVAFYGDHIHIGSGCEAGLEKLGLTRKVTKADDRELFTLDGKPALALYKKYLGKQVQLLNENFLFPIAILDEKGSIIKIRSVIDVNEDNQSIILNDTIQAGMSISLMTANFNRLVEGAYQAARHSWNGPQEREYFIIPISCTGRKKIMSQRIEEELSALTEGLPPFRHVLGFYSNGEISPIDGYPCTLQNHTMTLTSIYEVDDA